jgi:hypothetical protein
MPSACYTIVPNLGRGVQLAMRRYKRCALIVVAAMQCIYGYGGLLYFSAVPPPQAATAATAERLGHERLAAFFDVVDSSSGRWAPSTVTRP